MNKYREDICAYWLCENKEVVELVRSMGYQAYMLGTLEAEKAVEYTGVFGSVTALGGGKPDH